MGIDCFAPSPTRPVNRSPVETDRRPSLYVTRPTNNLGQNHLLLCNLESIVIATAEKRPQALRTTLLKTHQYRRTDVRLSILTVRLSISKRGNRRQKPSSHRALQLHRHPHRYSAAKTRKSSEGAGIMTNTINSAKQIIGIEQI